MPASYFLFPITPLAETIELHQSKPSRLSLCISCSDWLLVVGGAKENYFRLLKRARGVCALLSHSPRYEGSRLFSYHPPFVGKDGPAHSSLLRYPIWRKRGGSDHCNIKGRKGVCIVGSCEVQSCMSDVDGKTAHSFPFLQCPERVSTWKSPGRWLSPLQSEGGACNKVLSYVTCAE